jgi:hypothetical protein
MAPCVHVGTLCFLFASPFSRRSAARVPTCAARCCTPVVRQSWSSGSCGACVREGIWCFLCPSLLWASHQGKGVGECEGHLGFRKSGVLLQAPQYAVGESV